MNLFRWLLVSLLASCGMTAAEEKVESLFDGKSLAGWEVRTGEEKWWKVADGVIVGGSQSEKVPYNTFLASTGSYQNFELRVTLRLVKGDPKPKAGAARRSKADAQTPIVTEPRTPADELASFRLPEGFLAELVASEEQGVGKPITVQWDAKGRMWTMTAFEYPLDGNENLAAAKEIFARGGRDKVLVFDDPYGPGPHTPRVFAEGLALPLGMLPTQDGAFVQHGEEVRFYRDRDGDGRAEGHETVLEGFGIQDSHLFPHQFTRTPGGWIYLAQGLFNHSKVRRPGDEPFADGQKEIVFNQTKLARFRPDGSDFQLLTAGPNNIWGLVIARNGETFIQEANDIGMPVVEFEPGTHYQTGSREKLRPEAPVIPISTEGPQMGGTGLSGLALAEDRDTPFRLGLDGRVFFVVNPITNRIQVVTAVPDPAGHYRYEKREDFLVAEDEWFRPVAAHFGPDGCLYLVDWYNKIISHNEVPRNHPDRDKTRGRIWRVRHQSQSVQAPPDLTEMASRELSGQLGGPNALVAQLAWQELADRGTAADVSRLEKLAGGHENAAVAQRLGAFWALEGMGRLSPLLIAALAKDDHASLRYEAVRAAGEASLPESEFLAVVQDAPGDADYRVRAALANAVRYHRAATPAMIAVVAQLGREPLAEAGWKSYDRSFERCLARWAMESHRTATAAMLDSQADAGLPTESRLLAIQALEPARAAPQLLKMLPELDRDLHESEVSLLASELGRPSGAGGFADLLADPQRQVPMLGALRRLDRTVVTTGELTAVIETSCADLLRRDPSPAHRALVVDLARRYRLAGLAVVVRDWLASDRTPDELAGGLAALREMNAGDAVLFGSHLDHPDPAVVRQAVMGLARIDDPAVVETLATRWDGLSAGLRQLAIDGMTSSAAKAERFLEALRKGGFGKLDDATVEKLTTALGADHAGLRELWEGTDRVRRPVLRLTGSPGGRLETGIDLRGAFTLECWIRLDPGIDNSDNILGRRGGGPDINFFEGRLRVYAGTGVGDVIVARRAMQPHTWTHCTITRDETGRMGIYLDGEPDQDEGKPWKGDMLGLNIGETNAGGGCAARYLELRVWDVARSPEEIRDGFRISYASGEKPPRLVRRVSGDSGGALLAGGALVERSDDVPELLSPLEAAELAKKFARFRAMAARDGDAAQGRVLFQALCMACHQVKGEGREIGPDLSGAGATGVESLLRNVLTPSAQLESGYYRRDVTLTDGTVISGFLVAEDAHSVAIRQIGADDRVIPRKDIRSHTISRHSLMPEGLIESLPESQLTDLFAYLKSLK